jgi:hypothetical protein
MYEDYESCHLKFNNRSTVAVLLDIEKAFDTTWHNGLLYKLHKLKLSFSLINLISSFLSKKYSESRSKVKCLRQGMYKQGRHKFPSWPPYCKLYTVLIHLLLGSVPRAPLEVMLEVVFSMWSVPRLHHATDRVQFSECSAVQRSEEMLSELVRELQFIRCDLLLLQVGSSGTGIVQKPRVRGTSATGSRYRAMTSEDTADRKILVRAVLNCRPCELATAQWWLEVTICKWSIYPITFSNPVYSHSNTWLYI